MRFLFKLKQKISNNIETLLGWAAAIFIILGFVAIGGGVLYIWVGNSTKFQNNILSNLGNLGDYVSGIAGSLWALAGFIMFYAALIRQKVDTEKQLSSQKLQQFESTFFNSLSLLNDIIGDITYPNDFVYTREDSELPMRWGINQSTEFKGRESFKLFYNKLKDEYRGNLNAQVQEVANQTQQLTDAYTIPDEKKKDFASKAYEVFFQKYNSHLGHYFRTLYNIVKFIDEQNPSNAKYYIGLLRAQLSTYEHLLLFYNCISVYAIEKFKPLIIKYSILDNIVESELLDKAHKELYPPNAYNETKSI